MVKEEKALSRLVDKADDILQRQLASEALTQITDAVDGEGIGRRVVAKVSDLTAEEVAMEKKTAEKKAQERKKRRGAWQDQEDVVKEMMERRVRAEQSQA